MNTVRELLQDKIHEVASIAPDKSAHDAMQMMAYKKIGALLVEENGKMVGIISVLVKEIMSSHVVHVSPDDTVEHCMELVTKNHVRHLPVLEGDKILGIISIGDLSKT
jgi:CBS domain-containing protein